MRFSIVKVLNSSRAFGAGIQARLHLSPRFLFLRASGPWALLDTPLNGLLSYAVF